MRGSSSGGRVFGCWHVGCVRLLRGVPVPVAVGGRLHGRRCALRLPGWSWTRRLAGKPIVVVRAVDGRSSAVLGACIVAVILIDTCRPGSLVFDGGKILPAWRKRVCWRRGTLFGVVTLATHHHHGQDVQTSRLWARLACLGRRHNKHTVGAGIHILRLGDYTAASQT